MKSSNALVEILLTSNAQILGVTGDEHPFYQYYRDYGLPVSFSTDDEGVSHFPYTDEWLYARTHYSDLTYQDMVTLARYSLQYSFMKGEPLWRDLAGSKVVMQCEGLMPGLPDPPEPCRAFLSGSPKASMQWKYEAELAEYDRQYGSLLR